jgi:hypothetical protein
MSDFEKAVKQNAKEFVVIANEHGIDTNTVWFRGNNQEAKYLNLDVVLDLHKKATEIQKDKIANLETDRDNLWKTVQSLTDTVNEYASESQEQRNKLQEFHKAFKDFSKWFVDKYGKYASADEITVALGLLLEKFELLGLKESEVSGENKK